MSNVDKILSRLSHISQVLLVGLAMFGYIYTVRPIYQKELLAEQISKKQIELIELQGKVDQLRLETESRETELINFRREINKRFAMLFVSTLRLEALKIMVNNYPKLSSYTFFGEPQVGIAYDALVSPYIIIEERIAAYKNSSSVISHVLPDGFIEKYCTVADELIKKEKEKLLLSVDVNLLKAKVKEINKQYRGIIDNDKSKIKLGIGSKPSNPTKFVMDLSFYMLDPNVYEIIKLLERGSSDDMKKINMYFDVLTERLLIETEKPMVIKVQ